MGSITAPEKKKKKRFSGSLKLTQALSAFAHATRPRLPPVSSSLFTRLITIHSSRPNPSNTNSPWGGLSILSCV